MSVPLATGRRHGTFHPLRVKDVERLTEDAVAITFDVPDDLREATLTRPQDLTMPPGGGRRGVHTEPFGYLIAEMQHLHRSHPGATW